MHYSKNDVGQNLTFTGIVTVEDNEFWTEMFGFEGFRLFLRIPAVEQGLFQGMEVPPIFRRILAPSHSALLHVAHLVCGGF